VPGSLYAVTKWAVTGLAESLRRELVGSGVRVTLVEPGVTDTPFFDNVPALALRPEDLARAVMFAISQPPHVAVSDVLMRPTDQER
jgi:NADP-dependent 3-hydroxy acid dehydrogenase YdfG